MKKDTRVTFEKKESKSSDILDIEGRCFGKEMKIILVYFDANKDAKGKKRNEIKKEVEKKIKNVNGKGVMIIGDFNGHLEMLEKDRKTDANGKTVLDWMGNNNLTLLNMDEMCEGLYTRVQINQVKGTTEKSAIDFALVNEEMYSWCEKMVIDEEKKIMECSDQSKRLKTITVQIAEVKPI